jgi:hypothetical protein
MTSVADTLAAWVVGLEPAAADLELAAEQRKDPHE